MPTNVSQGDESEDARAILNAVRQLQDCPELWDEARANLRGALDRLGLTGVARHALATALSVALASGVDVSGQGGTLTFWQA